MNHRLAHANSIELLKREYLCLEKGADKAQTAKEQRCMTKIESSQHTAFTYTLKKADEYAKSAK